MAFVKVRDDTGAIDLVVFPKVFQNTRNSWIDNKPLLISGHTDLREEETSIIVDQIVTTEEAKSDKDSLYIHIPKTAGATELKNLKRFYKMLAIKS
jgi:DNA polymerase III alpha subunit